MSNKVSFSEVPDSKSFKFILIVLGIAFLIGMVLSAFEITGAIDVNWGEPTYRGWLVEHNQSYQEYIAQIEHERMVGRAVIMLTIPLFYAFIFWLICGHLPTTYTKCQHGHVVGKHPATKYCRVCGTKLNTEEPLA